jgi:hypothetical protein
MMQILRHYWRPTPVLPTSLLEAIENSLTAALRTTDNKIDAALLRSLVAQDFDAQPRKKILVGRKFEDDIRVCDGNHHVSIEIENDGNRLEFDLLKMMTFAEAVPETCRAWGCLIIPANKELKNPFISGNGRERIWNYLTGRLMPMTSPIRGRLSNILVLGFDRATQATAINSRESLDSVAGESSLRGLVQQAWIDAGKPSWDTERTIKEAIYADVCLERDQEENPAAVFRQNRINNNQRYLRTWVLGCKFNWLRKRAEPG